MNQKTKILSGLIWKFLERCGTFGIQFVIQIVLARLLFPADYGVIAIIAVFISLSNVFIQSGLNTALIQKKEVSDTDYSTVFFISLFIALLLYILLWTISPVIASFYKMPILEEIIPILSVVLFTGAINSVQNAIIARNLQFKKLFYSSLSGTVISGIIGIILAHIGFGVWALVFQQIANSIIVCLVMWVTIRWRPKLVFSWKKARDLFSFGWKLLVSNLLNVLYSDLTTLVVGRKFSSEILGVFTRGKQFPQIVVNNIDGSIQSVMLPAYSAEQDDKAKLKSMMRRTITSSSFFLFPMMVGLAAIATPLVDLLLTEKWLSCVPFLQLFCFSYALTPIHTANLQIINGMGRSDIFLRLEIIKTIVGLSILILTVCFFDNAIYLAYSSVFSGIISSFINASPNKKLLNYSYLEQIKDIYPSLFIALLMGMIVLLIGRWDVHPLLLMGVQCISGCGIYVLLSNFFNYEILSYCVETVTDYFQVKKKK